MLLPPTNEFKLLSAFIGFVSGIALFSFFNLGWLPVLGAVFLGILFLFARRILKNREVCFILALFLFGSALGMARYETESYRYYDYFSGSNNRQVSLGGLVESPPDYRNYNLRAKLSVSLTDGHEIDQKIFLVTNIHQDISYGDKIKISGLLKKIENKEDDSGAHFDYEKYADKDGIWYEMRYPKKIEIISRGQGNAVFGFLYRLTDSFSNSISRAIPEPESSLARGMLLGEKHALPQNVSEEVRKVGLSHLVVLSGYNIALVVFFVLRTLAYFPFAIRILGAGILITLFVIATGAEASSVRALLMALVSLSGLLFGRTYQNSRALGFAVVLMLLENPKLLISDPSFQLSVSATAGLIYLMPFVVEKLSFLTAKFGLRDIVAGSIATQIAVLPLLIYLTGQAQIMSLFANILALPVAPLAMLGSFISGVLSFGGYFISLPFAGPTYLLLVYILKIASIGSAIPFVSISAYIPGWLVSIWYVFFFLFLLSKNK